MMYWYSPARWICGGRIQSHTGAHVLAALIALLLIAGGALCVWSGWSDTSGESWAAASVSAGWWMIAIGVGGYVLTRLLFAIFD